MANILVGNKTLDITKQDDLLYMDGAPVTYDIIRLPNGDCHLVYEDKSYTITVEDKNPSTGKLSLSINGRRLNTQLENKLAQLLKSMGMESGKKKLKELKAPMPGLVLQTLVSAGDVVTEGQELLVLEAMKMENAIKSPQDGTIKTVEIQDQQKVEKNQVLITFD